MTIRVNLRSWLSILFVCAFVLAGWLGAVPDMVGAAGTPAPSQGDLERPEPPDAYASYLPLALLSWPAPTPPPAFLWPPASWLEAVNYYRDMAGLPSVAEEAIYSQGDWYHARYMVKNDYIGHDEDPAMPWYTVEGDQAAAASNLVATSRLDADDVFAVDMWMQAPFHAVGVLDPKLRKVGYGSYREAVGLFKMAAALDVIRGRGAVPPGVAFPIFFPGDGSNMPVLQYVGEYPSPLTSCPGYAAPSGPPIILQLGTGSVTPVVGATWLRRGSVNLAHCVFSETSYANPDAAAQALGRSVLNSRDAVVIMPREPFLAGAEYTVSVTVNGAQHTWSFRTAGGPEVGSTAVKPAPELTSSLDWVGEPPFGAP